MKKFMEIMEQLASPLHQPDCQSLEGTRQPSNQLIQFKKDGILKKKYLFVHKHQNL